METLELAGVSEIAQMLGTSRQYASQLSARRDFPAPVASLAMGKVWRREDVLTWARDRGREVQG